MAWTPTHPGEVLLATLTGQPATGIGAGSGVVQMPLDPVAFGYPVPPDFVSANIGASSREYLSFAASRVEVVLP